MVNQNSNISDSAVRKATGKSWHELFAILDRADAQDKSHKEIVALLADGKHVENGWWQQMVTVEYEKARGLRITGQTADADFQIGVQKTLPLSPSKAWELITDPPGRDIWLGPTPQFELARDKAYCTDSGIHGEVRSVDPGKRLRLTWQPLGWPSPATLQVYLFPTGDKTSIRFHQEKLASQEQREEMRRHWQDVLKRLEGLIKG